MRPIYVYVAGPLSCGNVVENVRMAVQVSDYLLSLGYTPFCPHLTHFWAAVTGDKTWDQWLDFDERWLQKCDVLFRLSGESPGADREVSFAHCHGIPVVYCVQELIRRFPLNSKTSEPCVSPCGRPNCPLCCGAPEG